MSLHIRSIVRALSNYRQGTVHPRSVKSALAYQCQYFENNRTLGYLIVSAYNQGFHGYGKVTPDFFYAPFIRCLNNSGVQVIFRQSGSESEWSWKRSLPCISLNIISEDKKLLNPYSRACFDHELSMQLNPYHVAHLLRDKVVSMSIMKKAGIDVPLLEKSELGSSSFPCFINKRLGSGITPRILHSDQIINLTSDDYVSRLIDTTFQYRGRKYRSSIRLLSACGELMACFPRLRKLEHGDSPSVHSADTPLDPELINSAYIQLVRPRLRLFKDLCAKLHSVFEHSFLAHDLLIDTDGKVFVCESGFKFDDYGYTSHLSSVYSSLLPELQYLWSPKFGYDYGRIVSQLLLSGNCSDA